MKHLMLLLVIIPSLCEASEIFCQLFDDNTQSLEEYCENFRESVPLDCSEEIITNDAVQVTQLKIRGCDNETVLDAIKRFRYVRTLDISYSEFKSLKWFDLKLERLMAFNASHNELLQIPQELIKRNPDLAELDLSYNNFEKIDSTNFRGAGKLEKVFLSHNFLNEISYKIFWDSKDLEHIDLSNNYFLAIPIFPSNEMLRTIHLEENPIEVFGCSHLTTMSSVSVYLSWKDLISFSGHLDCEGRELRVIRNSGNEGVLPAWSRKYQIHCNDQSFKNVRYFAAGRNGFENVTEILPCLGSSVTYLDLSGNIIGHMDTNTFKRFIDLSRLYLSDTKLIEFDFSVLQNQEYLITLDLSSNYLQYINNIELLMNFELIEFMVAENQLVNTPEMIQYLRPSVEKLDFSGNFVEELNTTTFDRLTAIQSLNLSDTVLYISDFNPFQPFKGLVILDISYNNLDNLNATILSTTLNELSEFYAANCHIENASDVIFHLGPSIEALDISGNTLNSLNATMFEMLRSLQYLNLSNTNLMSFDYGTLHHQSNLHTLDISYNKLREIDLWLVTGQLERLSLEGNDLVKVNNFEQSRFQRLQSLAISRNWLPYDNLKELMNQSWDGLEFVGDPFNQKYKIESNVISQNFAEFLTSVYNKVKFW